MYDYRATVLRIIGPLSLHLDIDLGFNVHTRTTVRLDGLEQPEGDRRAQARAFVKQWLDKHETFLLRSLYAREKYGRWLVVIKGDDDSVLNAELVSSGLVHYIDSAQIPDDENDSP